MSDTTELPELLTMRQVANILLLHPVTVSLLAREHGIGTNFRGSAGWRFTAAEVDALRECRRVKKSPVAVERRRRRRRDREVDGSSVRRT